MEIKEIKEKIKKEYSVVTASRGMLEGVEQITGTITVYSLAKFIKGILEEQRKYYEEEYKDERAEANERDWYEKNI